LQLLKENAGNVESVHLSSDQPSEPKSLDVALNIAGVEKNTQKWCECGQPGGHLIRVLNRRKGGRTVEICVLPGQ